MSAGPLGIAAGFLPAHLRAEATAAVRALRVLSAYERSGERRRVGSVVTAEDYLSGHHEAPDPVLADHIRDVRALLLALPLEGRQRVGRMLADVGAVMAHNRDSPLPRTVYGELVLGRVMLYACSLVAEDACAEADLSELAG